jgi:ring-1,2-phenylacetyl-CoA epoxidase subunit PaaE
MAPRFHRLAIAEVRRETPDAVSIAFAVPDDLRQDFAFTSGQYLTLRTTMNGEEVRRSYSICSGIDDGELRVAIKRLDGGLFSCFANENLKAGDTMEVMTPMGRFGVEPDPTAARTYVAFAAGSGITPVLSIIKTVLGREPKSRFNLFYGNRSSNGIIFKATIEDLKDVFVNRLSVHHILSREAQDVALLHGRLGGDKVAALMRTVGPIEAVDHVFLCGPVGMIEEVSGALRQLGVPENRIHTEVFTPEGGLPAAPRPISRPTAEPHGAQLRLRLDGATHEMVMHEDETVLDAALRNGLDLPYSCRGGMCCTCRAKLVEGGATMDQNFSLEPWEMKAGFVLTCQSRPTTPSLVVDFDAV